MGLALVTLIAQVESTGRTRVLVLNDCPAGLDGFYAPSRNRIGLCRNNHNSDAALNSTLLHEAVHRLQHCRQPALADQLDAANSIQALEEEARELQRWGEQSPKTAADWLRRQLKEQCADQPREPVIAGVLAHLLQGIGDRWRGSYCLLDHFNTNATPRAPNGWEMFRVGAAKRTSRSDQPRSSGQQAANAAQR